VYLCVPDISWFYQNTVSINEDTQPGKHRKNCGGTRVLVPFQVDNRFFVLISKMDFSNINLSIFPSVFMCSAHFLFLLEHCQHKWEYTIKKTTKKYVGALEFWCPGTSVISPSRKPQKIVLVPGHQNSGAPNVHD
jgi:hypothetical protein